MIPPIVEKIHVLKHLALPNTLSRTQFIRLMITCTISYDLAFARDYLLTAVVAMVVTIATRGLPQNFLLTSRLGQGKAGT